MDRQHHRRRGALGEAQIGGNEPRLPVMRMHDIGLPAGKQPAGQLGPDPGQTREPLSVVGPIHSAGVHIGIARTAEEMRRIDRQDAGAVHAGGEQCRRAAEEIGDRLHRLGRWQRRQHRRIPRQQRGDDHILLRQRAGQRARDIGQSPRLDERKELGGDGQDLQLAHRSSASIIGCVMRQMPEAERRNRLASSSGSWPTTRPSGMFTAASTMTLVRCTLRAMLA